jgi:hypothetical protein
MMKHRAAPNSGCKTVMERDLAAKQSKVAAKGVGQNVLRRRFEGTRTSSVDRANSVNSRSLRMKA